MTLDNTPRILFFIHSLGAGGAERVTASLANHWAKQGWHVTIVTTASRNLDFYPLHPAIERISVDLARNSRTPLHAAASNLSRIFALRSILTMTRPHVAIGMMTTAAITLILAALGLTRIATIASEHIHPPTLPLGRIWETLRRWTYPLADRVTVLTADGLSWLEQAIPRAHGVVVPNPIQIPLTHSEPVLNPDSFIQPNRKLLLAVGRLSEEKGFDTLLTVFARLAPIHPEWDLAILGEGPLRAILGTQIEQLGLTSRAYLPGRAGNMADWYRRANLFVLSSRFEGFGLVLAEAMAHGCAAVSFDCDTGPRDIIRHEVDGLLAPAGDEQALACALDRLMNDEALRRRFSAAAVQVRERFSLEKIANMWERLFEEIRRVD